MIHRYHLPHYEQVAVYFWPILFFELWRVDQWCAFTGRWAVVEVDRYGRAWVPYWEGMSVNYHVHGMEARMYAPGDVEDLCPGWLKAALTALDIPEFISGPGIPVPERLIQNPGHAPPVRPLLPPEPG